MKISVTELRPRAQTTAAAITVAGANVTAPWASETMTLMVISPKQTADSGRAQSWPRPLAQASHSHIPIATGARPMMAT